MKPVVWLGDSLDRMRSFPDQAKRAAGHQIARVQWGAEPADWKPMPTIGLGVHELRVHAGGAFRVIFVAKFPEAVYVLHAFQKKSSRTAHTDIDVTRRRYKALIAERKL